MIVEHRTLTIRLNDTVFARLIDRAREQGRTPTRYAQELFDAAWAARCGKGTGDAALERAVRETPAPATGPDPRDAKIAALEAERDALQRSLAAAGQTIDAWKAEAAEWDRERAAVAEKGADLNRQIEIINASLSDSEAEVVRLREQLAKPVEPVVVAQPEPAPEPEPQSKPTPAPQPTQARELAGCTVRMIKALRATGMTPAEIARETDTSILDVRLVLDRKAS